MKIQQILIADDKSSYIHENPFTQWRLYATTNVTLCIYIQMCMYSTVDESWLVAVKLARWVREFDFRIILAFDFFYHSEQCANVR